MSLEERRRLCNNLFFQDAASRSDLMDPTLTSTYLIQILANMIEKGYYIEITAVRTDHHPDGYRGKHSHQAGRAVDCWPLYSAKMGDYLDENSVTFRMFLEDLTSEFYVAQIGLGGAANTKSNMSLLGDKGFADDGEDHVHVGE